MSTESEYFKPICCLTHASIHVRDDQGKATELYCIGRLTVYRIPMQGHKIDVGGIEFLVVDSIDATFDPTLSFGGMLTLSAEKTVSSSELEIATQEIVQWFTDKGFSILVKAK